jgi:hypothetical protein
MLSARSLNFSRCSILIICDLIVAHNSSKAFVFWLVHVSIDTVFEEGLEGTLVPFIWIPRLLTIFATNVTVEVRTVIINWAIVAMVASSLLGLGCDN